MTPSDDSPEKPDVEEYLQGLDLKFSPLEYQSLETRRKLLLAYLQNDGWEWRDMSHNDEEVRLPPVG